MTRATVGVWLNYATTFLFQVVFAARFGGGEAASTYVLAFSLTLSVGSVFAAVVQTLVVPRALSEGVLGREVLEFLGWITGLAALALSLVALGAPAIAHEVGTIADLPAHVVVRPLQVAALFAFVQVVGVELGILCLASGGRFAPAFAPAFPSVFGVVAMAASGVTPSALLAVMTIGGLVQCGYVAFCLRLPPTTRRLGPLGIRGLAIVTATQYVGLAALPTIERVLAGMGDPSGLAHFNYAARSLAIAQQLIIGGLVLAALGDWSSLYERRELARLAAGVETAFAFALSTLAAASAVAVLLAAPLVAAVYERGVFTASDTAAVAGLLVLAVPGFVFEGVGLVASQALLSAKRNAFANVVGFTNFALRAVGAFVLGRHDGARGVALSYSITTGLVLVLQIFMMQRARLWPHHPRRIVAASCIAGITLVISMGCHFWLPQLKVRYLLALALVFCVPAVRALLRLRIGHRTGLVGG